MKRAPLLFAALIYSCFTWAQHTVQLRNLWAEPHVHVLFDGYTISFTIKDINRAIELLAETGDSTYGLTSGLDTAKEYATELYPGYNTEYKDVLQPLLQKGIGAYLLSLGHAEIRNPRHKTLKAITVDVEPPEEGGNIQDVKFYDAKSGKLLFNGRLSIDLAHKDIGID